MDYASFARLINGTWQDRSRPVNTYFARVCAQPKGPTDFIQPSLLAAYGGLLRRALMPRAG